MCGSTAVMWEAPARAMTTALYPYAEPISRTLASLANEASAADSLAVSEVDIVGPSPSAIGRHSSFMLCSPLG